ncbi:hypothetical protein MF265_21720 [Serratia marcescens]|uniref:hypothetical protein n=1 Tax=Serratia marcescens TaxID=615 RepID=UPI001EF11A34|nr:hypothetical protein [Serratia marcescens]ULH10510.1 hypothetical protein MF265_21720 [Serratia marcescens]
MEQFVLPTVQTFLKMRRLVSEEITQLINHISWLMAEYGIVLRKGATELRHKLPELLEDAENGFHPRRRRSLRRRASALTSGSR